MMRASPGDNEKVSLVYCKRLIYQALPRTIHPPGLSLDTPAAERPVQDFSEYSRGKRICPLQEVLYDSLVWVIAGPEAREMIGGEV